MKITILFVLTILAIPGFSQSQKAIHAQLQKDLAGAKISYDSIYREHTNAVTAFAGVYKNFRQQLNGVTDKRRKAQGLAEEIVMKYRKVRGLGIDPDKLIDTAGVKRYNLPNYHLTELDVQGLSQFAVRKEIPALSLEGTDPDKQDEQMINQVSGYQSESHSMKKEKMVMDNLKSTTRKLDSLNVLYDQMLTSYSQKEQVLQKKLDEEKERFRLKGPDGFSKAYRSVFPDVHPYPGGNGGAYEDGNESREREPMARQVKEERVENKQEIIYDTVDELAEFPGGMTALKKYITENLVYPQSVKDGSISGRVSVQFVVNENGYISNVKVKRGIIDCPECDQEAVRVVKNMPKWNPAKMNGETVHSTFQLPVNFEVK